MARITISGIDIDYELLGKAGAPAIAITPGGRFSKNSSGVRELGEALASGGKRALVWDRPNCGASDISFDGETESVLGARVLTKLIRALDLGPTVIAGGSAGSRVSLIAASRDPEICSHLCIWWISGGPLSLLSLAYYYCVDQALAANKGGMEAVAQLPAWAEQIKRNPKNRDILLAQNPEQYVQTMERWAMAYMPSPISPVPGMSPEDFAQLRMPTLVYRSGKSDLSHTRKTSEWVHRLIPQSKLIEPPWADDEWNHRSGTPDLFASWPKLAPQILDFTAR